MITFCRRWGSCSFQLEFAAAVPGCLAAGCLMSHPSFLLDLSLDHQTINSRRRCYQRSNAPLHSLVSDALPTHLLGCTVCVHASLWSEPGKPFLHSQTNEAQRMNGAVEEGKTVASGNKRNHGVSTVVLPVICVCAERNAARVSLSLSQPQVHLSWKRCSSSANLTFSLPPSTSTATGGRSCSLRAAAVAAADKGREM